MTDAEQIERFIKERGVTQCPPGIAAPTRGVVVPEDTRERLFGKAWAARRGPTTNGWMRAKKKA